MRVELLSSKIFHQLLSGVAQVEAKIVDLTGGGIGIDQWEREG